MYSPEKKQRGVVLIVSLIFLLLLSILAATVIQTNTLQLQMASNDESKMEAMQRALAIVDAILDDTANTPVAGDIGYRVCAAGLDPEPADCDEFQITIGDATLLDASSGVEVQYYVDRVGPLETPIPYLPESIVSSSSSFKVARQEINVVFDRTDQNQGYAEVSQGYLRLITSPETITTISN